VTEDEHRDAGESEDHHADHDDSRSMAYRWRRAVGIHDL
jgi:hypothetical protein